MRKILPAILVVSLCGNFFALALWLGLQISPRHSAADANTALTPAASARHAASADAPAFPPPSPDTWRKLRGEGPLPDFIARLRAAGFPPLTVRAIVEGCVAAEFTPQRLELQRRRDAGDGHQNLMLAQRARLAQLLGADYPERDDERAARLAAHGSIPAHLVPQVAKLLDDYTQLTYAARRDNPAENEQLALVAQERRRDLLALITPEQLEELELRDSFRSRLLRDQLSGLEVSSEEFRALYRAKLECDHAWGPKYEFGDSHVGGLLPPEQDAPRQKMLEQVRATLGEERFWKYLERADPFFAEISRAMPATKSSPPTAWATWRELQAEYARTLEIDRRHPPGTPENASARALLRRDTDARLVTLLGPEGLAKLTWRTPAVTSPTPIH